jgi:DNA-binding winged helix-turn-helix (wHTH) protein/tetratricopeptide (TPR) repeat protein
MKSFGPFRLDPVNQCLWREEARIPLTPKVFAVLRYLVDHPGRLVTQDELLEAIWPETYVQPEVLRRYILDLRKALDDRPRDPVYIETFPKRGYQFIAPVLTASQSDALSVAGPVGRERELDELDGYLSRALGGHRQVVFVTGEAGIGKSTLLDAFEQRAASRENLRIGRGQCVEGFGGKEAYYPVLDALGQLVRGPGAAAIIQILAAQAPTWLIQFPSLLQEDQRAALQREILGATRERMVREICHALEVLTAESPLALILEDLHWVDTSTLDLISAVARGRGPAKLILLGSYRPVEAILLQSPLKALKQDLMMHKLCCEIVLERLAEPEIAQYLSAEFPDAKLPEGLAALIHRHSEGNPLFMAAIVTDLVKNGLLSHDTGGWTLAAPLEQIVPGVPDTLQQMIEIQVEGLSETEQRVLKSASVAGRRFSAWAVAGMLQMDIAEAEEICHKFTQRQQFLRPGRGAGALGGGPAALGGTLSTHYEFHHALYRRALYQQLAPAQRAQLHRSLAIQAEGLLAGLGPDAAFEMASELALHFENGRDFERAAHYLILSARNAGRRYAHLDAIATLEHALSLLAGIAPDKVSAVEIEILEHLSDAHYALGEMDRSAQMDQRALEKARERGHKVAQVNALTRLARVFSFSDPDACVTVCEQAVDVSRALNDPLLLARTELLAACWRVVNNGWTQRDADICAAARRKIDELQGPGLHAYYEILYAHVQAIQAEYADSYAIARAGVEKAAETHSLVVYLSSLSSMALALIHMGRWGELQQTLRTGMDLSEKNGNEPWRGIFEAMLGWLHMQAFDFDGARRIAEALLEVFTEEPAGQVQTIALLTIGYTELTAGNPKRALECFTKVRDRQATPKVFLQWYWRMISEFGLVGAYLKQNHLETATAAADQFLRDALTTADPALRAPAWDAVARVAALQGDLNRAVECVEQALASIEHLDLPSVAWRVHATAARVQLQRGNREAALRHSDLATSHLRQAAASFSPGDRLHQSLMAGADHLKSSFQREWEKAVGRTAG